MKTVPAILPLLIFLVAGPANADECRRTDASGRGSPDGCRPAERLKPYEPERLKAGSRPGFIDLGGGTEVRIGGRVQMDYDTRR